MSVLITGVNMPSFGEGNELIVRVLPNGAVLDEHGIYLNAKAAPVPPHGRLIDADALRQTMYHEAFETDSPLQKWDSGCWIRYKMFERMEEAAPTIIPAEEKKV